MKVDDRTIVWAAARRIDGATQQLGAAYRELSDGLAQAGHKDYHERGNGAAEDLNAVCQAEVAGVLVAVGMGDVFKVPLARTVSPVADFYPRWKARIDSVPGSSSRSRPASHQRTTV